MAVTEQALGRTQQQSFSSVNPSTGKLVDTFPVHGPPEVTEAVTRARTAAAWWADLGFDGRRERLEAFKGQLARRADELAWLMHDENGKPVQDAFLEILLTVEHLAWAARNAKKVLGLRRVRSTALMANHAAYLEYQPFGVIGVIGPWNYPVYTPMGSLGYALAAGNAVVYKPSEYTPAIGQWLADAFAVCVPEQPVWQNVYGFGETGNALCTSGVDKVAFTGSARTGRKVMAACAQTLTPVLMECGGKDAMIVDDDADVAAAADTAVWGALQNAGQACISVERVYVTDAVYDRFLDEVVDRASRISAGDAPDADIGPITMPGQVEVIQRHLTDAFQRGAKAVVGGPESVRAPFVDPVVLVDVPEDAAVIREETFGPVLPITRVRDADEAVERANASDYGLASVVFAKRRGLELARRLRAGMTSIGEVLAFAGVPALPFGGVGESGFGRIHGPDGLKEFTRAKAITRQRFGLPGIMRLTRFGRHEGMVDAVAKVMRLRHGRH